MMYNRVLLPTPDSPMMASRSPWPKDRSRFDSTSTRLPPPAKDFASPRTSINNDTVRYSYRMMSTGCSLAACRAG